MKSNRGWLLLALPIALTACGGGEGEGDTAAMSDTATAARPAESTSEGAMAAMPTTVALQAVGTSGASGQATLTPNAAQTQVQVQLTGVTPGAHPGHIHSGTCAAMGAPVHPLPDITAGADGSGTAETTLPIDATTVMDGQHLISYHGDGGAPIVCGELTAHTM
ncbi:MAG: hypothetical protein KY464_15950 [Gemmatimonadetes bacterium]|nr:hypothetical protein [Gemmatimonadota bacterium]